MEIIKHQDIVNISFDYNHNRRSEINHSVVKVTLSSGESFYVPLVVLKHAYSDMMKQIRKFNEAEGRTHLAPYDVHRFYLEEAR
jgi:hypothetical protein